MKNAKRKRATDYKEWTTFPTFSRIANGVKQGVSAMVSVWRSKEPYTDPSMKSLALIRKLIMSSPGEKLDDLLNLTKEICDVEKVRLWFTANGEFKCLAALPYLPSDEWKTLQQTTISKEEQFIQDILGSDKPMLFENPDELKEVDPTIDLLSIEKIIVKGLNVTGAVKGLLVIELPKNCKEHEIKSKMKKLDELGEMFESLFINADVKETLKLLAVKDSLTTLYNSGRYMEDLKKAAEEAKARDDGKKLVLMLLDVDGFKSVNDVYSHGAGDAVLRRIGKKINQLAEKYECVGYRRGGDEFALLMWLSENEYALVTEYIYKELSFDFEFENPGKHTVDTVRITLTAGVDALTHDYNPQEFERLVDLVLLGGKQQCEKGKLYFGLYSPSCKLGG